MMARRNLYDEMALDPLSQGKACYVAKDFKGALEAFTRATKISSDTLLLNTLDCRAATYEKLGDLKAALRDAKEMIELRPSLAKGYLRCAKVLQLKGESALALKIYERGLKKVKINTDNDRPLLQRMYSQLKYKQAPTPCFDPMVKLPAELAATVCNYLDMRDRVICLAVSKPWKRFLESSHELWTKLDLQKAKRNVSQASLRAHFRRSNYTLKSAIINPTSAGFDAKKFRYLTRTCKELSHLELHGGVLGESLIESLPEAQNLASIIARPSCSVSLPTVVKILALCPQIEVAEFHVDQLSSQGSPREWPRLQHLQTLKLTGLAKTSQRVTRLDPAALIEATPNLKAVSLVNWDRPCVPTASIDFSRWTQLQSLNLSNFQLRLMPSFPPTLKHLDISKIWHLTSPIPPVHLSFSDQLPDTIDLPVLESFNCNNTPILDLQSIFKITKQAIQNNTLKVLNIGNRPDEPIPTAPEANPHIPSLEHLSFAGFRVDEDRLRLMLQRYPNLRRLDLSATKVTGVLVRELLARPVKLQWLGLSDCSSLSSDAADLARRSGVEVYP